jgi:hypothetical protein
MMTYEMPVDKAMMPKEVLDILDDMAAHNRAYDGTQKLMEVRSWSLGEPDGEIVSDYWQVTIYDRLSELFYIYNLHYYWEFDLTKCDKSYVTISRDDMLTFLGNTQALYTRVKPEVA